MARIRTIKPEFFSSKSLGKCSPHARLLGISLLTLADCDGRLAWVPLHIYGAAFPYESGLDIEALGEELVNAGFLERYTVGDRDFAWIVNFNRHQKLNGTERKTMSRLPNAPGDRRKRCQASEDDASSGLSHCGASQSSDVPSSPSASTHHGCRTTHEREEGTVHRIGDSSEGLPESTPETAANGSLRGDNETEESSVGRPTAGQWPASSLPVACLERGKGKRERGIGKKETGNGNVLERGPDADASPPSEDIHKVVELWNSSMGQSCVLTAKRREALRARFRESVFSERWREAIAKAAASNFCRGENDRGWRADLDWFVQRDSAEKLLEGKFDNRGRSKWSNGPGQVYDPNANFGEGF